MTIAIHLNEVEMIVAAQVGSMRRIASMKRQLNHNIHSEKSDWNMDIYGAAAEMAVGKHFNIYWKPTVNAGKAPDVGRFQVRATTHQNGHLLIRENDEKNEQFIFVTADQQTFKIIGWIWSDDAKKDKFWKPADHTGAGAWWVPQSALQPMETIDG